MFYVYQLRLATETQPFYIGKGQGNRAFDHLISDYWPSDSNRHKVNKIKKALEEGVFVEVEILEEFQDERLAFAAEIDLIARFGRVDKGNGCLVNMTNGGEGTSGRVVSQETRILTSRIMKNLHAKGGVFNTPEQISRANSKRIGQTRTEEFKLSQAKAAEGNTNVRGFVWVNDGQKSYRVRPEEMREGLTLGRCPSDKAKLAGNQSSRGLIWVNNGTIERKVKPEDLPSLSGYVHGRITAKLKQSSGSAVDVFTDQLNQVLT